MATAYLIDQPGKAAEPHIVRSSAIESSPTASHAISAGAIASHTIGSRAIESHATEQDVKKPQ